MIVLHVTGVWACAQTGGKGVHLALNSLSDDKLQVRNKIPPRVSPLAVTSLLCVLLCVPPCVACWCTPACGVPPDACHLCAA